MVFATSLKHSDASTYNACNYDPLATELDDSRTYSREFHDCNGNCFNDADGDGVCDELERKGVDDPIACN